MKRLTQILIIGFVIASVKSLTMSWGNLQPRNLIMFDQFFHEKQEVDMKICKIFVFTSQHGELITAIHVTDLTNLQNGGRVKINCGGIGYTFVRLQLTSECSKQILLNIEIFGAN